MTEPGKIDTKKPEGWKLARLIAICSKDDCKTIAEKRGILKFLEAQTCKDSIDAFVMDLNSLNYTQTNSPEYSATKAKIMRYIGRIAEEKAKIIQQQLKGEREDLGEFKDVHPISAYQDLMGYFEERENIEVRK